MLSPPEELVFFGKLIKQTAKFLSKSQVEAVKVKENKNKLAAES